MPVSVLIPVYNAEKYLREAVESAVAQPETGEIIIWDDCSTDNSFAVCCELENEFEMVVVRRNLGNLGNYATRNHLIRASSCEYVSFLDADDYYVPGRFSLAVRILDADPTIDVVYEAYENFYEDEAKQTRWLNETSIKERLVALPSQINPSCLFRQLMIKDNGATGLPQLVARRRTYDKIPLFEEGLMRGADRVALYQMAYLCKLVPGSLDRPVLMRRLHNNNISTQRKSGLPQAKAFYGWAKHAVDDDSLGYVDVFLLRYSAKMFPQTVLLSSNPNKLTRRIIKLIRYFLLVTYFPHLITKSLFWKNLAGSIVFG